MSRASFEQKEGFACLKGANMRCFKKKEQLFLGIIILGVNYINPFSKIQSCELSRLSVDVGVGLSLLCAYIQSCKLYNVLQLEHDSRKASLNLSQSAWDQRFKERPFSSATVSEMIAVVQDDHVQLDALQKLRLAQFRCALSSSSQVVAGGFLLLPKIILKTFCKANKNLKASDIKAIEAYSVIVRAISHLVAAKCLADAINLPDVDSVINHVYGGQALSEGSSLPFASIAITLLLLDCLSVKLAQKHKAEA